MIPQNKLGCIQAHGNPLRRHDQPTAKEDYLQNDDVYMTDERPCTKPKPPFGYLGAIVPLEYVQPISM